MGITFINTIKRKLVVILMLTGLATAITGSADAQFWKKKRHKNDNGAQANVNDSLQNNNKPLSKKETKKLKKETKKKEKKERKKLNHERKYNKKHNKKNSAPETQNTPTHTVRRPEDAYPLTKMKDRYRVDILVPMYLDELVKGESVTFKNKVPAKAEQGIAFYEGILIAADSLKKAGFKIDIYVHDVASAAESADMLVVENKLDSTDLIIGAVPPRDLSVLAVYARKKQVNFVSALSSADGGVQNNPYFTLMAPSLKSHCEWIVGNVAKNFPGTNVGVLYRTSVAGDNAAYRYLTDGSENNTHFRGISCNSLPDKATLSQLFDTTRPNIVIIPILDLIYADSLLTLLSADFPSTHFEVFGLPSWSGISDLRKENAFPNLSVNVTMPFHVDLSSPNGKYVTRIFKRDYGDKVPEMAYRGYEAMFWYANLLKQYGTIFNISYEDNTTAPFTSFEMKPQLDKNGNILFYENRHVFVSKYEAGVYKTE